MCGYLRRHVTPRDLRAFLDLLGVKSNDIDWGENEPEYDIPKLEHFYPAWGGNTSRTIKKLLVEEQGELKHLVVPRTGSGWPSRARLQKDL